MSDRHWRERLTLGIAIIFYVAWLLPVILSFIPPLEYDPSQYPTNVQREEGRQEQDTYAQIWMAWAAWLQVAISFFGLVGLGLTVYFARNAWLESRRAADQAKRQADIAESELLRGRPELNPLIEDDGAMSQAMDGIGLPHAIFRPRNTGGMTAIIECYDAAVVLAKTPPKPDDPGLFEFDPRRLIVPPNKDFIVVCQHTTLSENQREAIREGNLFVYCVGYIAYSDRMGGQWETGFTYWFWPVSSINPETGERKTRGLFRAVEGGEFNFDRPRKSEGQSRH